MSKHLVLIINLFLFFTASNFTAFNILAETNIEDNISDHSNPALTLEEAMDKAQKISNTLAIAGRQVDIAVANRNAQILSMLPNISVTGSYLEPIIGSNAITTTEVGGTQGIPVKGTTLVANANLTQPITGLYSLVLSLRQTSAQLRGALQTKNQTTQEVRFLAASSFINATKTFHLIKVAQAAIQTAQKQLSDAEARFNEGLLTNADVLKFKLNVDNARNTRVHAETSYQIALITLAEAIGEHDTNAIVLPTEYQSVMEKKKDSLGELDSIVKNRLPVRYDLLISEENITAQYYAKLNAIANYIPTLNFVMNASRDFLAKDTPHLNKGNSQNTLFYGLSLTWNLLDWGVRQMQINSAGATEQIARLELNRVRRHAKIDIVSNYNQLMEAYESLRLTRLSVEYAESVYKQRLEQFQSGLISSTDLVIASDDQTTAQGNYVAAVVDLDLAWMSFYKAINHPLTTLN